MLTNDPLSIATDESYSEESKDHNFENRKEDSPLILVVDDELINIELICMMMAARGYVSIDKATNGAEALEFVTNRLKGSRPMYRLILLDYSMPKMDGPSVSRAIRKLWKP